jgi:hypothetical protein
MSPMTQMNDGVFEKNRLHNEAWLHQPLTNIHHQNQFKFGFK